MQMANMHKCSILSNNHRFSETNIPLTQNISKDCENKNRNLHKSLRFSINTTTHNELIKQIQPSFSNLRKDCTLISDRNFKCPKSLPLNLKSSPRRSTYSTNSVRRWQSLDRFTKRPLIRKFISSQSTIKLLKNRQHEFSRVKSKKKSLDRVSFALENNAEESNVNYSKSTRNRLTSIHNLLTSTSSDMALTFKKQCSLESSASFMPEESVSIIDNLE